MPIDTESLLINKETRFHLSATFVAFRISHLLFVFLSKAVVACKQLASNIF